MSNNQVVNPAGIFYVSTVGIEAYSFPGCLIVASFYTVGKPEVQAARKAGAIVLLYVDFVEIVQKPTDSLMAAFYKDANPWPTLVNGMLRVNWPGTVLADITVGSKWAQAAVVQIKKWILTQVISGSVSQFDGLFMDVAGGRLYSVSTATEPGADWDTTWTQPERDAWTAGCVDIVKQLDIFRRAINPRFILVNNNVWTGNGPLGEQGENNVNGVCLENHLPDPASATGLYASRKFSGMWPRIVMSISRPPTYTVADAQKWAQISGITHVVFQSNYTGPVPAPAVKPVKTDCSIVSP